MTSPFHLRLTRELDSRRNRNLWRTLQLPGPHRWNLAHNDYLQLRRHPDVIRAAQEAAAMYGAGSGASPLLTGYQPCHDELLNRLKAWKQKREGLLFNTGFMANQALLKHLPGPRDLVLADRLVHHSMTQALASRGSRFRRYRHLDLGHLEELLDRHHRHHETLFVVTESVYSMDGDYPDLAGMAALKRRRPFIWILDEAHGA
ncbi:MAG: aminotransferase class I/II-fold pyridoxal phosphate-dependent enzyme, partial [Nitrospinaceae bacterium]